MATMSTLSRKLHELEQRLRRRRGPGDVVHVVREGDPPEPLELAGRAMRHVWGGLCPTGAGIAFAGLYGALVRVTGNRADNRAGAGQIWPVWGQLAPCPQL